MRTRCLSLALVLPAGRRLRPRRRRSGAAGASAPVNGGTLVYALPADPVSVTPLYGGDAAGLVIERNVFAGLVDADPSTLRTVPVIARSWSSTPDARTYTFRLRPHVSFPGGAGAVTAATFVADWRLLCSPGVASPNAAVLEPVSGYAACASGSGTLSGVRATGPLTLVVQLSRPVRDFPSMLADPATWAFPPQLAATAGDRAAFERAPVGAGPFRLASLRKSTHPAGKAAVAGLAVLSRNPAYFGARPHLDRVEMPVVAGADAGSIAAYRAGRYQVLPLPAAEVDVVRADPEFGRQLLDTPRLSLISLQRRPGATSSLAGGLSASQVTELAAGKSGQPADALVPLGMPGYVPNVTHFAPAPVSGETVTLTRPTGATETSFTKAVARVLAKRRRPGTDRPAWRLGGLGAEPAVGRPRHGRRGAGRPRADIPGVPGGSGPAGDGGTDAAPRAADAARERLDRAAHLRPDTAVDRAGRTRVAGRCAGCTPPGGCLADNLALILRR